MSAGLVKGEGFAVDASVMEADASRYHGQAPGETDWSAPERQTRAVAEFLSSPTMKGLTRTENCKGDLADGPLLGLDGEGEQAGPIWLWPQLHD